jgi:hypothetical protein
LADLSAWVISGKGGPVKKLLIVFISTLLLMGCDNAEKSVGDIRGQRVAALPLIQQAITSRVPLFDGGWNQNIMGWVCQRASGELTNEQFVRLFQERHVDVQQLAGIDAGFNFISHLDESAAQQTCAAWMAATLLAPVDAYGEAIRNGSDFQHKMVPLTPLVARMLDILADIAARTADRRYSDENEYQKAVWTLFSEQASEIVDQMLKAKYTRADYFRPGSRSMRYQYQLENGQPLVMYNGVRWLGYGEIKGYRYLINIQKG